MGPVAVPPLLGTEPRGDSPCAESPHVPARLSGRASRPWLGEHTPCQGTRTGLVLAMGSTGQPWRGASRAYPHRGSSTENEYFCQQMLLYFFFNGA